MNRTLPSWLAVLIIAGCGHHQASGTLPPRVATDFSSGKVTLLGSVPDEAIRTRISARANSLYGPEHVSDQISVDPKVMNSDWLATDSVFLPLIDNLLSDGQAAFDGRTLILTGRAPTEIIKAQLTQRAAAAAGAGITVENHLQIPH